jgi:hypothetical protein
LRNRFYYLHRNGNILKWVPGESDATPDPSFFASHFVIRYWELDLDNRMDAWNFVIESLACGARPEQVMKITAKWGLTKEDAVAYMSRVEEPSALQKKGLVIFIEEILGMTEEAFWEWYNSRKKLTVKNEHGPAIDEAAPASEATEKI